MSELTYIHEAIINTLAEHTRFAYESIREAFDITESVDRTINALSLASCLDVPLSTAALAVARPGTVKVTQVTEPWKQMKKAAMYFAADNHGEPGERIESVLPIEFWCVFVGDDNKLAQFVSPRGILPEDDGEEGE